MAQGGWAIRCNSIPPAAILTPMWETMLPLKRFGLPEEIAAIAVMLASDEATYMTGAELTIDGGLLAGSAAPHG